MLLRGRDGLLLYFDCLLDVIVLLLFFTSSSWVGLQCVIVSFLAGKGMKDGTNDQERFL